jgi:hypothetical protein
MIGARPVYDIAVGYGSGKSVSSFRGGTATISIPYTLGKNETVGGLYAVYVDEKGNATRIAGSAYDANAEVLIFTTTHFPVWRGLHSSVSKVYRHRHPLGQGIN